MANINTLQTINKPKFKIVKPRGQYPKPPEFHHTIKLWYKIAEVNADIGKISVIPTESIKSKRGAGRILDSEGVEMAKGVLSRHDLPSSVKWDNDKMENWRRATATRPAHIELGEYGLGLLISGDIGVLDFDCEQDWNWFKGHFNIDVKKYIVASNISDDHDCSCDAPEEKTYHLYFKKTDWFSAVEGRSVRCIVKNKGCDDETDRLIDYLQVAKTGTPQVVKIPCKLEGCRRKINHLPSDYIIQKLPPDVIQHFKNNWRNEKDITKSVNRNYKFLDLLNAIPISVLNDEGRKIVSLYYELDNVGVDIEDIKELAVKHRSVLDYIKYKKNGQGEYTETETMEWIDEIITNYDSDSRSAPKINLLCREHNLGKQTEIHVKSLDNYGKAFSKDYVRDISYYIQDPLIRRTKIKRYYDYFFLMTTGVANNGVYFKKYDDDGDLCEIKPFTNKSAFMDYCGVNIDLDIKGCGNSAKYWWDNCDPYDKVIFQPYGIDKSKSKYKLDRQTFNVFTGYKMKMVKGYHKPDKDYLGDRINDHLRDVICANSPTGGGCNEELYLFHLAWFYKHAVLGKKTDVGLVWFSDDKGTGKSILLNGYMEFVIGNNWSLLNSDFIKMMNDQFTDYYEDICLLAIEEMPDNNNKIKDAWNFVKSIIDGKQMTSRKFHQPPDKMVLHFSMIFLTNHFYSVDKGVADRRIACNEVSNHRKNDEKYFDELAEACDSYDGWENFIHRYLITGYNSFSHINVKPQSSLIPMTTYKKKLMRRGNDAVLYFFRDLLDNLEDPENEADPYHKNFGKEIGIQSLYQAFKDWCITNQIECNFDRNTFVKVKLEQQYKLQIISVNDLLDFPKKHNTTDGASVIKKYKNRRGDVIKFDKQFLSLIKNLIKKNSLLCETPITRTKEENDALEIDIDMGGLDFL